MSPLWMHALRTPMRCQPWGWAALTLLVFVLVTKVISGGTPVGLLTVQPAIPHDIHEQLGHVRERSNIQYWRKGTSSWLPRTSMGATQQPIATADQRGKTWQSQHATTLHWMTIGGAMTVVFVASAIKFVAQQLTGPAGQPTLGSEHGVSLAPLRQPELSSPATASTPIPTPSSPKPHAIILPGFLSGADAYDSFVAALQQRQCFSSVEVLPIRNWQWLPTLFGSSFRFYMNALEKELTSPKRSGPVVLLCHSAGGWLARLYLGLAREGRVYDGKMYAPPLQRVALLVTLGTPHYSAENYPFGRVKERRKDEDPALPETAVSSSLQLTNLLYDDPCTIGCPIVSVCGASIHGGEDTSAGRSYRVNGCEETSSGDGVTPLCISVANGSSAVVKVCCTHSAGQPGWYGSEEGIEQWIHHVFAQPR